MVPDADVDPDAILPNGPHVIKTGDDFDIDFTNINVEANNLMDEFTLGVYKSGAVQDTPENVFH